MSGTGHGEMPQSLATPAIAGFHPIAENGTKVALTTGMTTDTKNFQPHEFHAIMITTKYPGVAYRLGTWFGTKVRLVRLQSLGPKVSEIVDFRDFFFVYCGAGFERKCYASIDLHSHRLSLFEILISI